MDYKRVIFVIVVLILGSIVLVSYNSTYSNYTSVVTRYNSLVTTYNRVSSVNSNLTQENSYLQQELNQSSVNYQNLLNNYSETKGLPQHVSTSYAVPIWTFKDTMPGRSSVEWELLDTFDNHLSIQTNQTSRYYIFDLNNFVLFASGRFSTPVQNITGTKFTYDVTLSEGCGAYVLYIQNLENSPTSITPNVTATYEPTPFLTGVCATPLS